MNATKAKYKTWDATIEALERLEAGAGDSTQLKAQLASVSAELAVRNAEIKALKAAGSSQQSAAAATSQEPATKTPDQMTLVELTIACDEATHVGDHAAANRFYRAYEARKQASH